MAAASGTRERSLPATSARTARVRRPRAWRPGPERRRRPPVAGGRRQVVLDGAGYFFGIIDPVCRYRVWNEKASSNMCGEWRPALGFFMARFT
jgi:hypothetical protein